MKTAVKIGTTQWVIIGLTLVTAIIHLFLPGIIFKLNTLGYLGLLAAYFLVIPGLGFLKREWVRWAFMGYAAITIVAYFVSWGLDGFFQPVGIFTKLVELALIFFLWRDR